MILGGDHESPPALANGGGGLVSTVTDYARFAQMLLNDGELDGTRIVSAEAVKLDDAPTTSPSGCCTGFGVGAQQIRPGFGYGWNGAVFTDSGRGRRAGRQGRLPLGWRRRHLVLGRSGATTCSTSP